MRAESCQDKCRLQSFADFRAGASKSQRVRPPRRTPPTRPHSKHDETRSIYKRAQYAFFLLPKISRMYVLIQV